LTSLQPMIIPKFSLGCSVFFKMSLPNYDHLLLNYHSVGTQKNLCKEWFPVPLVDCLRKWQKMYHINYPFIHSLKFTNFLNNLFNMRISLSIRNTAVSKIDNIPFLWSFHCIDGRDCII
jgi:hypothetical protein